MWDVSMQTHGAGGAISGVGRSNQLVNAAVSELGELDARNLEASNLDARNLEASNLEASNLDASGFDATNNVKFLIEALVRQTAVLIAQLATTSGGRPSLANVTNDLFVELAHQLRSRGVGNKVAADMFGMALRTFQDKLRQAKLREQEVEARTAERSLWEKVWEHLQQRGTLLQSELLEHFQQEDSLTLRSVLTDLVESGLVFRGGRGSRTLLRATGPGLTQAGASAGALHNFVCLVIHRLGMADAETILQRVPVAPRVLQQVLTSLLDAGRIRAVLGSDRICYVCDEWGVADGSAQGWQVAVFDHYQALVAALGAERIPSANRGAAPGARNECGASTFAFEIWPGHPLQREVVGLLSESRQRMIELKQRVSAHNAREPVAREAPPWRVVTYVGQAFT